MRPQPAKRQKTPCYPTRLEVVALPGLLRARVPLAWLKHKDLLCAAGIFLASNGCASAAKTQPDGGLQQAQKAIVAPVFVHGKARGVFGCVAVAPAVFVSEEEARQIIKEEFAKYGILLTESGIRVKGVPEPREFDLVWRLFFKELRDKGITVEPYIPDVQLDLRDQKNNINIEYISSDDQRHFVYNDKSSLKFPKDITADEIEEILNNRPGIFVSSGKMYTLRGAAVELARELAERAPKGYYGVFYDPLTTCTLEEMHELYQKHPKFKSKRLMLESLQEKLENIKGYVPDDLVEKMVKTETELRDGIRELYRDHSRMLLRAHVKDFTDWLKAQGAI